MPPRTAGQGPGDAGRELTYLAQDRGVRQRRGQPNAADLIRQGRGR